MCASLVLVLAGCTRIAQSLSVRGYDRDIENSTRAIGDARDSARRAAGYARRGRAYSEKARYCRMVKLIAADEYARLFALAVKDHDQAVALDPGSAGVYFSRGQTYYDRAAFEVGSGPNPWFEPAVADFKKALERDGRNYMAWDMLGIAHQGAGEWDEAISDFTQEMALNPLGRARLPDAYCQRGSADQRDKKYTAAIVDYEKAIALGADTDSCACDPFNPLIVLYDDVEHRPDKSWDVVHKARKSGKWIGPELLDKLRKDSGRDN